MFVPLVAKPKSKASAPPRSTDTARRDAQQKFGPNAQGTRQPASWDLRKVPRFPPGSGEPPPSPRSLTQPKLKVGATNTPLEQEADRVADQAGRLPTGSIQPRLRVNPSGNSLEMNQPGPAPNSFRGRGRPLSAPVRRFFERQFDHSFSDVRVHDGPDAAESARSLGARAYTYGREIVFGAGEYLPREGHGTRLLAHELAHVVQQSSTAPFVQRSPLSDSVKKVWDSGNKIEPLLARLQQSDVQSAQGRADSDIDTMLANELAAQPDNLWLAQRIRQGELGKTTGEFGPKVGGKDKPRSIEAFFFQGSTDRRALVIAGVHGTERQGMEVARDLIHDLQPPAPPPLFSTIIVPSLFPDNAETFPDKKAPHHRETGPTGKEFPTNRNFPPPSEDLAAAKAAGGGKAVDAITRGGKRTEAILPENQLLLQLIETFHPERILSIHGTWRPGAAGVFYDPRNLRANETKTATDSARVAAQQQVPADEQATPEGQKRLAALQDSLTKTALTQAQAQASDTDRDLSLKTAQAIDKDTASIPGRKNRDMIQEDEDNALTKAKKAEKIAAQKVADLTKAGAAAADIATATAAADKAKKARQDVEASITPKETLRSKHPSVGGNVGTSGKLDFATWSSPPKEGVSLGGYAPPRGISVFTVEPPLDSNTDDYAKKTDDVTQANRRIELQAYADAVRTILLGS